jgi:cytochrome b involved in lipid metabolism
MKKIIIVILILAILGGGYWFYTQNQTSSQMAKIMEFVNNTQVGGQDTYVASQVAAHNTASDCWVIINSKVVNATSFISLHPGGSDKISRVCGQDITEKFNRESAHMQTIANAVISKITIGTIAQ